MTDYPMTIEAKCGCGRWNEWIKSLDGEGYLPHTLMGIPHHETPCRVPALDKAGGIHCYVCVPQELCIKCYSWYVISDWPFCPHGRPHGMLGEYRAHMEYNITDEPVWITSLAQKQRLLKDRGLTEMDHKITVNQAWDRMAERRERTERLQRERR